jgi:hypothetical protein
MGIHIDNGAISDPEALRAHIERAFDELFALVPAPEVPEPETTTEAHDAVSATQGMQRNDVLTVAQMPRKKRWFRKRT